MPYKTEKIVALLDERDRYQEALVELLNVAERIRGGDPKLDPEEWYAIRDYCRVVLKNHAGPTSEAE